MSDYLAAYSNLKFGTKSCQKSCHLIFPFISSFFLLSSFPFMSDQDLMKPGSEIHSGFGYAKAKNRVPAVTVPAPVALSQLYPDPQHGNNERLAPGLS